MSYTVFENQNCSGTRNTRLKQHTLLFFFLFFPFFSFLKKWYKQQYKIVVLLTVLQKRLFWLDNCAVIFPSFFFFLPFFFSLCLSVFSPLVISYVSMYTRITSGPKHLGHAGCDTIENIVWFYGYRTLLSDIKRHMQKAPVVQYTLSKWFHFVASSKYFIMYS